MFLHFINYFTAQVTTFSVIMTKTKYNEHQQTPRGKSSVKKVWQFQNSGGKLEHGTNLPFTYHINREITCLIFYIIFLAQ